MLSDSQSDSKICLLTDLAGLLCRIAHIILPEPSPILSSLQFSLNEQLPQWTLVLCLARQWLHCKPRENGKEKTRFALRQIRWQRSLTAGDRAASREHPQHHSQAEHRELPVHGKVLKWHSHTLPTKFSSRSSQRWGYKQGQFSEPDFQKTTQACMQPRF